jgi:hypothetical protein
MLERRRRREGRSVA